MSALEGEGKVDRVLTLARGLRADPRVVAIAQSTARQAFSGLVGMGTNILMASTIAAVSFAAFTATMVSMQIVSAGVAFVLYPLIYSELSKDPTLLRMLCRRLLLPLLGVTSSAGALTLALGTPSNEISNWQLIAGGTSLAAAAILPAFALGLQNYRVFNSLELVPGLAGFALIVLMRPSSAGELIAITSCGYLMKVVAYLYWLTAAYRSATTERNIEWREAIRNGAAVGISGAAQSAAFRTILLSARYTVPASNFVLIAVAWQFAEKVLVVPQAINAIMFGHFKRGRTVKGTLRILALGAAGSVGVIVLTLVALVFFRRTFAGSYDHVAEWFALVSVLFFVQALRIMVQNALNALGRSRVVLWDALAMLFANGLVLVAFGSASATSIWSLSIYCIFVVVSLLAMMRQFVSLR